MAHHLSTQTQVLHSPCKAPSFRMHLSPQPGPCLSSPVLVTQPKLLNSKPTLLLVHSVPLPRNCLSNFGTTKNIVSPPSAATKPTILFTDKENELIFDSQFGRSQPGMEELFGFVPVRSPHGRDKRGSKSTHLMDMKKEGPGSHHSFKNWEDLFLTKHYLSFLKSTFWDPGFTTHTFG